MSDLKCLDMVFPESVGHIAGGGFFVATLYWLAYVRKPKKAA